MEKVKTKEIFKTKSKPKQKNQQEKTEYTDNRWSFAKYSWIFETNNILAFYAIDEISKCLANIMSQPVMVKDLEYKTKTKLYEIDFLNKLKTTSQYYNITLGDFILRFVKPYRVNQET
jgi:hypothetical protein